MVCRCRCRFMSSLFGDEAIDHVDVIDAEVHESARITQ